MIALSDRPDRGRPYKGLPTVYCTGERDEAVRHGFVSLSLSICVFFSSGVREQFGTLPL